jgi:2'-5' RNA ligase
MLYVLSYPVLGNGDAASIEAYRQVHEPARAALIRAHITVVFGVRSITAHDLSSRVAAVAREQAPFEVSFDHVEQVVSPGNVHNIFLLASEGAMALKAMHRELYAGTLSSELLPDLPFRAHMTVATAASADPIQAAMKDLPRIALPVRGMINALNVVSLDQGVLRDAGLFYLGGQS